jgi:hypothetical protein
VAAKLKGHVENVNMDEVLERLNKVQQRRVCRVLLGLGLDTPDSKPNCGQFRGLIRCGDPRSSKGDYGTETALDAILQNLEI